ncbi:MAG: phosphate acyltransferase PlsX [Anaerolineaceae bacterium]|nr:phosphate acyltransferase PlsX [Anaerolineaceae bacterium]
MRIAVDALGTDSRPDPDIEGAVLAAREYNIEIALVGPQKLLEQKLGQHDVSSLKIDIVDAPQEIKMAAKPSEVTKGFEHSSMHVGMELVKSGEADAFVTMGNTGAAMAVATLNTLKRIKGVKRPALTAIYPIFDKNIIVLDIGANADIKPEWMVQFAEMGSIYARTALAYNEVRVATLSIGEEQGKGNQLLADAQKLLIQSNINYIGHIEPKEILDQKAEVIVFDGFVGNVFLKTFEGSIRYFTSLLREEVERSLIAKIGALLMSPAINRVRARLDTNTIGGAPLLGVDGVVIIGHGSTNAEGVKNAIGQAKKAVSGGTLMALKTHFAHANQDDGQAQ